MKLKNFPVRMDEDEHKDLKIFCVAHGISMQEFVTEAIREKRKKVGGVLSEQKAAHKHGHQHR